MTFHNLAYLKDALYDLFRVMDVEKKTQIPGGKRKGINWETGTDIFTFSSVQSLSHVQLFVNP